ncbi:restriction endonuclease subunit S [Bifidobacterium adolescentis]|uniref:Restriction endonuclease subunit S n=3 Tax=Bifidobacterium adolescentis TaxID=1680 RepID=A0AAW5JWX3_BIFAD|nr:restriction endonuclease subunit S [Bifidobacterium adolescentis]MCQ4792633.1 restriction endonuclease subunit S [Bifidobacterium adolescentis]
MAEQHEKALVPQIRFTGFTDPWEQRKLGELTEIKDSARIPNRLWREAGVPYIRASDISQEDLRGALFIDEEDYAAYKAATGAPEKGDVLFNGGGEIGKAIINGNSSPIYVQGGAVLYARIAHSSLLDARYLVAAFVTQNVVNAIGVLSAGGTMKHFTLQPAKNLPIEVPSIAEQRRIGAFFDRLDSLITLHQRKYDKLCVLKKSMLDKMFPKGGSLYPEIRFAGFTDPWEQRKLGELFEESDERASDREILSVSVANGIYPASESDRETNPGASLANYKVVHSGDVVYNSMRMWQGAVDASRYDGIVSPAYVVAKPNSEVYARFFARLLRQPMLLKQYQQVSQGNSKDTQVLKFDDFASIEISMPASENEQRQIGAFFDRLDSLITLHQRKLELLRNIKKSMLDKMFV